MQATCYFYAVPQCFQSSLPFLLLKGGHGILNKLESFCRSLASLNKYFLWLFIIWFKQQVHWSCHWSVFVSLKSCESVSLQNVGTLLLQNLCRGEGSLWITHNALWAAGFPDRNHTAYELISVGSHCEMRDEGTVLHSFAVKFGSVEYFMLYTYFCFTFLWCGFFLVTMLLLLLISVVVLFLFHFCFLPLSLLNLQDFNFRTWWKHFCMGTLPVLSLLYGRVATGHVLHLLSFVIPDQHLPGETPEDRQ